MQNVKVKFEMKQRLLCKSPDLANSGASLHKSVRRYMNCIPYERDKGEAEDGTISTLNQPSSCVYIKSEDVNVGGGGSPIR